MLFPVPEKDGLSKACTGGDQGLIPLFCLAHVQSFKVSPVQNRNAIGIGNEIIDHFHLFEREYLLE